VFWCWLSRACESEEKVAWLVVRVGSGAGIGEGGLVGEVGMSVKSRNGAFLFCLFRRLCPLA
jgi:hypothetical protein